MSQLLLSTHTIPFGTLGLKGKKQFLNYLFQKPMVPLCYVSKGREIYYYRLNVFFDPRVEEMKGTETYCNMEDQFLGQS
jgi:hypothetical protein